MLLLLLLFLQYPFILYNRIYEIIFGNVISGNVLTEEQAEKQGSQGPENSSILIDDFPSFKKILATEEEKDISNKAINYAAYIANSTGSELLILRILEDVDTLKDVNIEGSSSRTSNTESEENQNFNITIKGEIIDSMEEKIKKCQDAGRKIE